MVPESARSSGDRALASEARGRTFESCRARQFPPMPSNAGVERMLRNMAAAVVLAAAAVIGAGPAGAQESVLDGAFTDAQAERGLELYLEHCVFCHGPAMAGIAPFVPTLDGINFTANWRDRPVGDLLRFIEEFMPFDTPGTLDAQDAADTLAYILQYNGYPPGDAELPPEGDRLRRIRFVSLPGN